MASDATFAFGTKLWSGGLSGTEIGEITSITGVEATSDEIEVTNHGSPSGYREFIQGLRDAGTISIEGNFVAGDAGQQVLFTDFESGVVKTYAIQFPAPAAAVWEFQAFVMQAPSTESPVDDKIPFTAELRVTGQPTLDIIQSGGLTALTGIEDNLGAALVFVPAFSNTVLKYSTTVNTASTFVKLTPTAASHTILVNGTTVASGVESGEITLGLADSLTEVTIDTKETGKIRKIYSLTVVRP